VFHCIDDTIAAISSPAGRSARTVVRLSGPRAIELADEIFVSGAGRLGQTGGFRAVRGLIRLCNNNTPLETPGLAYLFRSPRSFTRQDVVELHVPGSPVLAGIVVDAMLDRGARQAEAGEFTARAFFNGRIDLSAAEAVADVINAADLAQLRCAVHSLNGAMGRRCSDWSGRLAEILAGVEASVDLADERFEFDDPADLADRLEKISQEILICTQQAGDIPDQSEQPRVVLAGAPNAGKSSLLNALSGSDRAIVSWRAHTTRDVLSAAARLPTDQQVVLVDAAGFCRTDDPLTQAATDAARSAVAAGDVVLFVLDVAHADHAHQRGLLDQVRETNADAPLIVLANKADLLDETELQARLGMLGEVLFDPERSSPAGPDKMFAVSAKTGEGLGRLRQEIADVLFQSAHRPGLLLGLHRRQKRCLSLAGDYAQQSARMLRSAGEVAEIAELLAVDLRSSLAQLGQISGQVVTEDILGRIFRRFCVGK